MMKMYFTLFVSALLLACSNTADSSNSFDPEDVDLDFESGTLTDSLEEDGKTSLSSSSELLSSSIESSSSAVQSSSSLQSSSSIANSSSSIQSSSSIAYGSLVDTRDDHVYKTVAIGNQIWMAENLSYKTADSYCYGDNTDNCDKYGRLYAKSAAMSACPGGWHLPSSGEWRILLDAVGGSENAGEKLKSQNGWNGSGNGTDDYGFSVLPASSRGTDGDYDLEGYSANFWSFTEDDSHESHVWSIYSNYRGVYNNLGDEYDGFSVRCLSNYSQFTDSRDGQTYKIVTIGTQTWMAENLNYETEDSYCYGDSASSCEKYGRLYAKSVAVSACPSGWHLPSNTEWEALFEGIGGAKNVDKLISVSGWDYGNGTDDYGFSVLAAGTRSNEGMYFQVGSMSYFWGANSYHVIFWSSTNVSVSQYMHNSYASIRCFRDF